MANLSAAKFVCFQPRVPIICVHGMRLPSERNYGGGTPRNSVDAWEISKLDGAAHMQMSRIWLPAKVSETECRQNRTAAVEGKQTYWMLNNSDEWKAATSCPFLPDSGKKTALKHTGHRQEEKSSVILGHKLSLI